MGDMVRAVVAEAEAPAAASGPDGPGHRLALAQGRSRPGPETARVPAEIIDAIPAEEPPLPPAAPRLDGFRDVAILVAERQDPMLHAHLLHSVHLVRFAPPVIELRPDAAAPRDLAPRLAALLLEATGTRWTIALSTSLGEPTLSEQGSAAALARHGAAAEHTLIRAILDAFPGARIEAVHDTTIDRYGLPAADSAPLHATGLDAIGPDGPETGAFDPDLDSEPDMPGFAPPEAEPAGTMPDERG